MNTNKAISIFFIVLTFGAIQESFRIFTSTDADIAENRAGLIPIAFIMTGGFLYLAVRFWRKSSKNKIH